MNKNQNKIALVIPVYKNQDGLEIALESVKGEAELLHVIIVDDGSVPAVNIDKFSHMDIELIRLAQNKGIETALNEGLKRALAEGYNYIGRMDTCDKASPYRFARQLAFMENNPDCALAGSWAQAVNIKGEPVHVFKPAATDKEIRKTMHLNSAFCHPAVIIRTDAVRDTGFYSDQYKAAEDYEFFFRIMQKYKVANIPEILLTYEIGNPLSISTSKRRRQLLSRLKVQLKYFECKKPHSYLGVAKTIILMLVPRKLVYLLKKAIATGPLKPNQ